nr:PAS domain S-box protein [Gemmobacter straminiformis]
MSPSGAVDGQGHREGRVEDKGFANFFEASADMLCIGDMQGYVHAVNPAWEPILGWTPAEVVGRPLSDFVHPDDLEDTNTAVASLRDGASRHFVNRLRARDGTWHELEWSGSFDAARGLVYATARDVTERRRAAFHHARIEAVSGVGSWEIDVESGAIFWSPETYRIHGMPQGAAVALETALDFYAPESRAVVVAHFNALMKEGTPFDLELQFSTAKGRPRWVRSTAGVEWRRGHIARIFGTFEDITERKRLEHNLEQERNRLQATLAAIPDPIFEVDYDGNFIGYHVAEGVPLFLPPDHFIGRPMAEVLPPDVAAIAVEAMREVDATGLSRGKRYRLTPPDGEQTFWYELSASARTPYDASSKPGYLFIARDITEAVQNEAVLRYRDTLLEALFDLSPVGIVLNDLETGAMVDANAAFMSYTGYTRPELLALTYFEVCPPEFHAVDAAQIEILRATGRCGPFEKAFLRKDGRQFPALCNAVRITDDNGRVLIWSLVEDITDRKLREERLQQAERAAIAAREQLVTAVEALPDGFVLYDADDRLVIANGRYKEIYAESAPAMIRGTAFVDILRYGLKRGQYAEAVGREETWLAERMHKHLNPGPMIEQRLGNGRVLRIFERKTPDGGSVGLRVDVTELHDARERAEEASRSKSLFLANMSHEIRTPLNGILGMADLLAADLSDPDLARTAQTIRESGETLLTILNDILDMSKIEAGKLQLVQDTFSPSEIGRKVGALHRLKAEEKGLAFHKDFPADLPLRTGDAHRLSQILHNLLSNAVKFTETGSVVLRITGGAAEPLTIEVRDTGIGMSADQKARIFDDFEQADPSMTRRYGGTGLGMSIVRRLTAMMDGRIEIDSAPDKGTTVRVTLPLPAVAPAEATPPRGTELPALHGVRALVADDNPINLQIIDAFLKRMGIETLLVENGRQAVEAWAPGRFDILCFDIAMPEMDGITALREIRRLAENSGTVAPPAVAVTANAMAHQVDEYLASGFAAHLPKPVRRADLAARVAALVQSVQEGSETL